VDGVSTSVSEGTAIVEACETAGSSVGVSSPSAASSSFDLSSSAAWARRGRATPCSSAATGALRRLLRRAARGGNGPGADSQGRSG
jgi:hypothetical protein